METRKRRLYDMEIDEISLVDRGANQHAAIVISKAQHPEEDDVSITYPDEIELYDEDGDPVEALEDGDVVYDGEGNAFVYSEDAESDAYYEDDDYDDYDDVGKALSLGAVGRYARGWRTGRQARSANASIKDISAAAGSKAGTKGNDHGYTGILQGAKNFYTKPGANFGEFGSWPNGVRWGRVAGTAGGVGAVGGGVELGRRKLQKSLGDIVMEELSKADSDDERNYVISKAVEEAEIAKAAAAEAWERVSEQEDANIESAFISKAAEYNLPVDPEDLGLILKAASTVLTGEQLDLLDQLFSGIGEVLYEEIGYEGDADNNSVMDVVDGYVGEYIGKADATAEMISTAIFDVNPEAYDAYLAENRR